MARPKPQDVRLDDLLAHQPDRSATCALLTGLHQAGPDSEDRDSGVAFHGASPDLQANAAGQERGIDEQASLTVTGPLDWPGSTMVTAMAAPAATASAPARPGTRRRARTTRLRRTICSTGVAE
jgi:hypothetical protein